VLRTKYGYLLVDGDGRCWFDNLAAKSLLTAYVVENFNRFLG